MEDSRKKIPKAMISRQKIRLVLAALFTGSCGTWAQTAELPYSESFTNPAALQDFTIIDYNSDGVTWDYRSGAVAYSYNEEGYDADDWLFSPLFDFPKDYVYEVQFDAKVSEGYAEVLGVFMASAKEIGSVTRTLLPLSELLSTNAGRMRFRFQPDDDETSCLALHVASTFEYGDVLAIDNIKVRQRASVHAPAQPALSVAAAEKGALQATLTVTLPTTAIDGTAISGLQTVNVYRGDVLVQQLPAAAPGDVITVDDAPPFSGEYTYSVSAVNEWGEGLDGHAKVYVGEDAPSAVEAMVLKDIGEGRVALTWQPPTVGTHGGYVNADGLTYEVTDAAGNTITTTELRYEADIEVPADKQTMTWFSVLAQGLKGRGPKTASDTLFLGKAYAMPYYESFSRHGLDNGPWNPQINPMSEWKLLSYGTYTDPQDADGGMMVYVNGIDNGGAKLEGPKVTVSGTHPTLRFWMFHHPLGRNGLSVILKSGQRRVRLAHLDVGDTEYQDGEWRCYNIPIHDYAEWGDVQAVFEGEGVLSEEGMNTLYIDHIGLFDWHDFDLRCHSLEPALTKLRVGETNTFVLSYSNEGSHTAEGYRLQLLRDGKVVDSIAGEKLEPGELTIAELHDTPNGDAGANSVYRAEIVWEKDLATADNRTGEVTVTVLPGLPFVAHVTAEIEGEGCRLRWEQPEMGNSQQAAETVTEDFENYTAFMTNDIGEWTLFDGDGRLTAGIQNGHGDYVEYPHVGEAMAYQVFNAQAAGLSIGTWGAHSGNQVLASFTCGRYAPNDDWLISPALDGTAQTVSFWAKSPDNTYYGTKETIQTMVSANGTETADFEQVGKDITVPGSWTKLSFDCPEGTRHFAIRCTSLDQYILFLDDITFCKAGTDLRLLGYHVYRDGNRITAEPVGVTEYCDSEMPEGDHLYAVSTVYSTGESRQSAEVLVSLTAIRNLASEGLRIHAVDGWLEVVAAADTKVCINDMAGRLIHNGKGSVRMALPEGVYVVNGHKVCLVY